ncbi:hypothetical protein [uncultured Methanocorpusculum sp.]|nr:hypothetical protein [uncultured Methanocorpusculum sp.]
MATFLDAFWDYFSGKTLPAPTLIGFVLGLAIAILLTAIVSMFILNTYSGGAYIIKIVGMTASSDGQQIELELVSGRDIEGLALLEVYINGIKAEPVSLPETYTPGVRITYKIPPNIGGAITSVLVVGTFKDGVVADLYNSTTAG